MSSRVVIAGAGIGGLTTAIALRRHGISARVLERATALGPVGAGLALQPNAMRALRTLGLDQAVVAQGAEQTQAALLDDRGRGLGSATDFRQVYTEMGAPTVALHRARLHTTLLESLDPAQVETHTAVLGYDPTPNGVAIRTSTGEIIDADLLVGADGLRSAVRAQMVGDGEPVYAGYTSWRGVTPAGSVRPTEGVTESWGRGHRFGIVGIGFGQIYWFAVANAPPRGEDADVRRELIARFGSWHQPIREIILATPPEQIVRTDISDRPTLTRWHDGRAVLLGDAAHPMTPNLGQGAGQAIEDAVALAELVATVRPMDAALAAYERRRLAHANALVVASRRFGQVSQWGHPVAVWARNTALRLTPASVQVAQARRLMQGST